MKKDYKFSLSIDSVVDLAEETEKQVVVMRDLVSESISDSGKDYSNMLLCESFALNAKLLDALHEIMMHGEPGSNYGDDKADQIVMEKDMAVLMENIMLARHYIVSELSSLNISTNIH